MFYLLSITIYCFVFLFSLWFYSTYLGARAIYHGLGAVVIDLGAIVAGIYAIYFSYVSYMRGVGIVLVLGTIGLGAVVSAMHLAKWIIRHRAFTGVNLYRQQSD